MKKLIYFNIIVFLICIAQISYGAGYKNSSSTFSLAINRTAGCTQISQISLSLIEIQITSKTNATISLNIAAGLYNAKSTINGTISGTTIDFDTKTINSSTCNANTAINIKLTYTFNNFGGNTVTGLLRGVATGAFTGNNTSSSVILTYFNGINGELSAKANAVVYSPTGIAKSSGAICTSDIIDVKLFGDNYQGVQLYLDNTPLGSIINIDNSFSVSQGFIRFTMAEKGITIDGIHTISLDINGSKITYATFQTYTPITNINVLSASKPISCYGEAINLNISTLPNGVTYNWSDSFGVNVSPRSISDFSKEYYIIMSKPGRTCEIQSNKVSIQVIPNFTASVSLPQGNQVCEGQAIQINAAPNDENLYNYAWYNGNISLGTNTNSIFVSNNGQFNVKVTPKNGGCESKTSTNTINDLIFQKKITGDRISVLNKTSAIFCKDDAYLTLLASANDITGISYEWSGLKTGRESSLQVESGGDYYLQLSRGACRTSPLKYTVIGKITPTLTLNPSDAQICKGQNISLIANPNNSNYSYQWFGGTDGKTDLKVNSADYSANDGGLYRVVLNPAGGNCNAISGVYEVSQQVKADAPITNFQITGRKANDIVPICNLTNGISLVATSDNDVSISWNGGPKFLKSNTFQNIKDERSYIAKFERGKCVESLAVTTKIQELLVNLKSTKDAITCSDNTDFKLVAEPNYSAASIKWRDETDANFSNTNKEFAPTKAGIYYAVANLSECGAVDSKPSEKVKITLPASFKVSIVSQLTSPICEGLTQTFTGIPTFNAFAGTYNWVPNISTSNILKSMNAGTYSLTIQQDGCKASAIASITTKPSKPSITVVDNFNLFSSPNTDSFEWLFKDLPSSINPALYRSFSPTETKDKLFTQKVGAYILKGSRNGCGIAYSDPIEITIITLANENINSNAWKVYPNPSNNILTIENNSLDFLQGNLIELRNSSGLLIKSWFQSEKSKDYSINDLSSGIYHLIFNQKNSRIVKKIIKL
jgi:hypothetical protein